MATKSVLKEKEVEQEVSNKLEKEEWDAFLSLQSSYNSVMVKLGEIAYRKRVLEPQLRSLQEEEELLISSMDEIRREQELFGKQIGEKYGDINIDLNTGTFSPTTN